MVLVRGGGGGVARAGRPACCVMLPPALMAYREREEGGFLGGFPVGGCAGVAALFTSFSLSILGPSIPVVFAAAGSGSCSLAIPCSCMLACVSIPLALFVPLGVWFVCLVGVASSLVACGFRHSVSRGWAPFIPSLLHVRYSLIPHMCRSSVLAASCSSRVLWRRPHFLWCWRLPPALMAYGERVEGGFHGISPVSVVYFLLVVRPWSFYPPGDCCGGFGLVLPCHTFCVFACARGYTTLALFVPSGLPFVCLVALVCSPATCGSLPLVSRGFPSYHHFFPRGLPTRYALVPSLLRSAVLVAACSSCVLWRCPHVLGRWRPIGCACSGKEKGWRFLWLLGALALHVSPSAVALVVYIHTFCCLRRHICAWAYLVLFLCPWVLVVRVFCGGGAPSGGVWFPPFGYIRVSLIPCFFPPCDRPRV